MLPWISLAALQDRLDDPDLRIVDVRFDLADVHAGRAAYTAGHLPGAVYLHLDDDLSGPKGAHGGRHPLPDPHELALRLGAAGIDERSHVVVYDAGDAMMAGRLWWLLRWLGHDRVQVLDGGLAAWTEAGLGLSQELPQPRAAVFSGQPRQAMLVSRQELLDRLDEPGLALVDARAAERYRGEVEPIDPVAGHIPGAVNLPFGGNLDGGRFRAPEALAQRFAAVAEADEVVVYCGSGVSAAHDLMALEAAGVQGARLYAGSWSDWVSYEDAPVATGGS